MLFKYVFNLEFFTFTISNNYCCALMLYHFLFNISISLDLSNGNHKSVI